MTRRVLSVVSALVVIALIAGAYAVLRPSEKMIHVSALFPRTVSLYVGNDVRVLGVDIGTITKIKPSGTNVLVDFEYPASRKVPADAKAVIVPPSIVSDRYIQLAPVYRSGDTLADGTRLSPDRTAAPLELDQILSNLNDLNIALGPEGANKDGALQDLLHVGAQNLDGQGDDIHNTVTQVSKALTTLAGGSDDLFAVVRQLAVFTQALKESDSQVRAVSADLATVSTQLNGERDELAAALHNLSVALGQVAGFVRDNKDVLSDDLAGLSDVTDALLTDKRALKEFLDVSPLALQNLAFAYNADFGTLDARVDINESLKPENVVCTLLSAAGQPTSVCDQLRGLLNSLPTLPGVPGIPQLPNLPDLGDLLLPGGNGEGLGGTGKGLADTAQGTLGAVGDGLGLTNRSSVTPSAPDLTLGGILEAGQ